MPEKARAHILVSGRVQHVWFRETAKKKAEEFLVSGWAGNLEDGRVEAFFEGDKDNVEQLIQWAKRGPFFAKVKNLELIWEEYKGEFQDFKIR